MHTLRQQKMLSSYPHERTKASCLNTACLAAQRRGNFNRRSLNPLGLSARKLRSCPSLPFLLFFSSRFRNSAVIIVELSLICQFLAVLTPLDNTDTNDDETWDRQQHANNSCKLTANA